MDWLYLSGCIDLLEIDFNHVIIVLETTLDLSDEE